MNSDTTREGEGRVVDFSDEEIGRISDEVYRHMRDAGYTGAQGGVWWNKSMYQAGYLAAHQAFALNANTSKQAAGEAVDSTFAEWLASEMPAGTVIGDPTWWANRIARQYQVHCTPRHPADEGKDALCIHCGRPTMHIGNVCFTCSKAAKNALQAGTP